MWVSSEQRKIIFFVFGKNSSISMWRWGQLPKLMMGLVHFITYLVNRRGFSLSSTSHHSQGWLRVHRLLSCGPTHGNGRRAHRIRKSQSSGCCGNDSFTGHLAELTSSVDKMSMSLSILSVLVKCLSNIWFLCQGKKDNVSRKAHSSCKMWTKGFDKEAFSAWQKGRGWQLTMRK